ncbi:MAG: hypothetical protein K0S94_1056, partial [Nitrospira sp.]|nr:hypothetical protein [Nitrospira sp.]
MVESVSRDIFEEALMRFRGGLSAGLFFLSMSFLAPLPTLADTTDKTAKETEKQKMDMEREAQKQ